MGQTCDGDTQLGARLSGISGGYRSDTDFHFQTVLLEKLTGFYRLKAACVVINITP